jgi:hypothetical protein
MQVCAARSQRVSRSHRSALFHHCSVFGETSIGAGSRARLTRNGANVADMPLANYFIVAVPNERTSSSFCLTGLVQMEGREFAAGHSEAAMRRRSRECLPLPVLQKFAVGE